MATDAQRIREAAARWGHTVDSIASRYTDPVTGKRLSGQALLLKTAQLESGALTNPNARHAVSSAQAKGWAQFTPGSRATAISKFGIDPWRSPDEAIHAMALHLRGKINGSTGLEGYNPGMPEYPALVLGTKVGPTRAATGGRSARAGGGQSSVGANGAARSAFDPGDVSALLADIAQPAATGPPEVGVPAAPTFAAAPVTPQFAGGLSVPSSGAPAPREDTLGAKLAAISTDPATFGDPNQQAAGGGGGSSSGGTSRRGTGKFKIAGADPGRLQPLIVDFAKRVAGVAGRQLVGDSGATHSKYTVNGNVSDHYAGNATDIPASGKELIRLGQDALIAAGWSEARARKQTGGLFNVQGPDGVRHQIIFNTHEGGDHTNHLHISAVKGGGW